ncbi:ABC transporter substrate-binding protein [Salinisphaera sp. SPP-AMP-43]|uniref:ABC transporter substrate-binding protein n=1 Tax=Salinisphaera sp. SPP-AMP-43 TaxID=3121288 RepID=UPI003C6E5498
MRLTTPVFRRLVLGGLLAVACWTGANAATVDQSTPAESGAFKVGVEPWLGYGLWHVAKAEKLYSDNGLDQVGVVNFAEDKDINAALASGHLDGASIALHTAMRMRAAGVPIRIVALLDVSEQADEVIADKRVESLADLKGKRIAFEEGTTSDILLRTALKSVGLDYSDIQPVPMPAASAGSALISGRVPAAATYEPYLTTAREKVPSAHVLYAAADDPGLISDVLVVRDDVLKNRPGQVLAMIKSWNQALEYYRGHTGAAQKIIADAVGAKPDSLTSAFDGLQYYGTADSHQAFHGAFMSKTYGDVAEAASAAGFLKKPVSADTLIDARFVDALSR